MSELEFLYCDITFALLKNLLKISLSFFTQVSTIRIIVKIRKKSGTGHRLVCLLSSLTGSSPSSLKFHLVPPIPHTCPPWDIVDNLQNMLLQYPHVYMTVRTAVERLRNGGKIVATSNHSVH